MRLRLFSICFLMSLFALSLQVNAQICKQGETCCPFIDGACSLIDYKYCMNNNKVVNCADFEAKEYTQAYCCTCPGDSNECPNAAYYSIYSLDSPHLVVDPGSCAGYDPQTQKPTCVTSSKERTHHR